MELEECATLVRFMMCGSESMAFVRSLSVAPVRCGGASPLAPNGNKVATGDLPQREQRASGSAGCRSVWARSRCCWPRMGLQR